MGDSKIARTSDGSPLAVLQAGVAVSARLQRQVEQFLFYEAALLDDRDYEAWFGLLAEDIHYFMPLRTTRGSRERSQEISGAGDLAIFDDRKASLGLRVRKLQTSSAWAEEPPSRTRRLVSNIRVSATEVPGEYESRCAFILYRNRAELQTDLFIGERTDGLRTCGSPAGFQIFRRHILLDQATLLANSISVFL